MFELQASSFVFKFLSVKYGFTAAAVAKGDVTTLHDEPRKDSMDFAILVTKRLSAFSRGWFLAAAAGMIAAQGGKIFARQGCHVPVQLHDRAISRTRWSNFNSSALVILATPFYRNVMWLLCNTQEPKCECCRTAMLRTIFCWQA